MLDAWERRTSVLSSLQCSANNIHSVLNRISNTQPHASRTVQRNVDRYPLDKDIGFTFLEALSRNRIRSLLLPNYSLSSVTFTSPIVTRA
jgi:hypothetical protein